MCRDCNGVRVSFRYEDDGMMHACMAVLEVRLETKRIQLQLRETWRDSSSALELCRDDFRNRRKRRGVGQLLKM